MQDPLATLVEPRAKSTGRTLMDDHSFPPCSCRVRWRTAATDLLGCRGSPPFALKILIASTWPALSGRGLVLARHRATWRAVMGGFVLATLRGPLLNTHRRRTIHPGFHRGRPTLHLSSPPPSNATLDTLHAASFLHCAGPAVYFRWVHPLSRSLRPPPPHYLSSWATSPVIPPA